MTDRAFRSFLLLVVAFSMGSAAINLHEHNPFAVVNVLIAVLAEVCRQGGTYDDH